MYVCPGGAAVAEKAAMWRRREGEGAARGRGGRPLLCLVGRQNIFEGNVSGEREVQYAILPEARAMSVAAADVGGGLRGVKKIG